MFCTKKASKLTVVQSWYNCIIVCLQKVSEAKFVQVVQVVQVRA
jgi:hypothetical protein